MDLSVLIVFFYGNKNIIIFHLKRHFIEYFENANARRKWISAVSDDYRDQYVTYSYFIQAKLLA
jgi:hypothetical protein